MRNGPVFIFNITGNNTICTRKNKPILENSHDELIKKLVSSVDNKYSFVTVDTP